MISALIAAAVLAQAPNDQTVRIAVGGQLGFPHLIGAVGRATLYHAGKPRFDLDVLWEPSLQLQSYSIGGAWHPADSIFFVGPRVRLLQFQAPWARGYAWRTDNHPGFGLEAGVRIGVADEKKGQITIGLQATWVPTQAANLRLLLGLYAGFTWSVFERGL